MAVYLTEVVTDLAMPPQQRPIPHQFAMGDNNAYTITALLCDSRNPEAELMDGTVGGELVRPDGVTVALEGEKGDAVRQVNLAAGGLCNATPCSVTLPQACFAVPGRVTLTIKLTDGTTITQALSVSAVVVRTSTDEAVDPGEVIPDLAAIQAAASEAAAAAVDARAAASSAVRYDTAQTLTDAQQAQARENIGAGTLGPNILCNLTPSNNTIKLTYNDVRGDSFDLENTGTQTYRGVSTTVDMQKYLVPGKRYHMHMTAETLAGTPDILMAIRNQNGVIIQSIGNGASGEFSGDFVATSEMYTVTVFVSRNASTKGSKVRFTDVSIREYIAAGSMDTGDFAPVNVLDPMADDVDHGKFISGYSNGAFTWTTNANYDESGYIHVQGLDRLYFTRASKGESLTCNTTGFTIAVYDADKQPICSLYPGSKSDGTCYIMPEGAAYVRVPIYNQYLTSIYIVPANVTVPDGTDWYYVPYGKRMLLDKTHWYGKTWYAYGTSITNTANEGKYANYLAKFGGMVHVNKGISGGGIGNLGGYSRGQVYNAICNITDGKLDADLITLETGANDTGADVPLGTIYDTGTSTLSGCLNDCIRYLQANTDAQIVVFCSPATTTVPTPESHKYYEWAEMVERICALNRVRFIRPDTNMGVGKLTSDRGSRYIVDTIHHTELGGYVYAEAIWSELKDVPLFYTEMPHI